jgi:hypothetical protein
MRFTLYSKKVTSSRTKTILESNDFEKLYNKGIEEYNKDTKREFDFFIVEQGVRAIKVSPVTIY